MTREEFISIPLTDLRIQLLQQSIASLRITATSLSAPLGGERVQSSGTPDRVGRIVAEIADAQVELEKEIVRLARLRLDALYLIRSLPEPERTIMQMRYIIGKRWDRIAEETNYTERNCYLIQRRAMRRMFG